MSPFSNTRTKRRTAFAALLVWLFALGSGWANACLPQDGRAHLHGSTDDGFLTAQPLVSPSHLGADSDHPENAGAAKGARLKVCYDDSRTIVRLVSSIDLIDVATAPPAAFTWSARLVAAAPDSAWLELPAPSPSLPLRTRFSRLAL